VVVVVVVVVMVVVMVMVGLWGHTGVKVKAGFGIGRIEKVRKRAWMVASAGETNHDMSWTQLAQKLGVYNNI
jgi:hypothetical protein